MSEEQRDEGADRIAYELVRAAGLFTRTVGRVPEVGYSSIAWRVLADLERGGSARVSHLAKQQRVAQPSMTSLVQRLESEGWIARDPDPVDGRATLVRATPGGLAALAAYRETAAARVAPLLARLDAGERETLVRATELLTRLSALD